MEARDRALCELFAANGEIAKEAIAADGRLSRR